MERRTGVGQTDTKDIIMLEIDSSIIFFFRDEELGWTEDGTDGWKGGSASDRQTLRILLCWRWDSMCMHILFVQLERLTFLSW
jgi:hypothetical protein